MGRVKPTFIKRTGSAILERYPHLFSTDFEENKRILAEVFSISKIYRNRLAGFITAAKRRTQA